ncbi:hypothetical protein COL154_014360 [Colletotrichum chrysophilum]|nr:hypothetical protein COL154_014360 [Colletotrichum chrysophilum]
MSRTGTTTIASAGEDGILYQGDPSSSTSETFNLSTGVDWAIDQGASIGVNYGLSSAIRDFTPTQSIAANFKLKF